MSVEDQADPHLANIVRAVKRAWPDRRVQANLSEAIRGYYATGRPLEDVIIWEDTTGPLEEARRLVQAIDQSIAAEPDRRSALTEYVVTELDPLSS